MMKSSAALKIAFVLLLTVLCLSTVMAQQAPAANAAKHDIPVASVKSLVVHLCPPFSNGCSLCQF